MPKGLSLHIGLNLYDKKAYRKSGLEISTLPNCNRDAIAKQKIASENKFNTAVLLNENATIDNVLDGLSEAATRLWHGDIFFISFSGHGHYIDDQSGDEEDKYDETWCMYNGMISDDQLFEKWKLFRPGVRILIIADCCHSGTSSKHLEPVKTKSLNQAKTGDLQASCLLISACQDTQTTPAGRNSPYSLFTHWLLKVWDSKDYCRSYRELHNRVAACMPDKSKPNLYFFGPRSEQFVKERPFKI